MIGEWDARKGTSYPTAARLIFEFLEKHRVWGEIRQLLVEEQRDN